jgi:hypothetical protein
MAEEDEQQMVAEGTTGASDTATATQHDNASEEDSNVEDSNQQDDESDK